MDKKMKVSNALTITIFIFNIITIILFFTPIFTYFGNPLDDPNGGGWVLLIYPFLILFFVITQGGVFALINIIISIIYMANKKILFLILNIISNILLIISVIHSMNLFHNDINYNLLIIWVVIITIIKFYLVIKDIIQNHK